MSELEVLQEKLKIRKKRNDLQKEIKRIKAKSSLLDFIEYTSKDYDAQFFHREVCRIIDKFEVGDIKKLMIFIPPQHGKSQISSRHYPSYTLGRNPKKRVALCSYGADHAQSFNRDIQRIIDDKPYNDVFPETVLNASNVATNSKENYKRTANIFETVGYGGFLKTVGVGGALTGTTVDLGIIDDPLKDREAANSQTIRDRVWNWYTDVFESRLHNDSQQLLLFTRWHDDDLGGRVLRRDGRIEDGGQWTIITLRALKEDGDDELNPTFADEREIGEALWENKHSRENLEKIQKDSPISFASLYQQRPSIKKGNFVQRDWFGNYDVFDLLQKRGVKTHMYIDTALSEKEISNNDPTGILIYSVFRNQIFLRYFSKGMWGFPELIRQINKLHGIYCDRNSIVNIENKSNGASVEQYLRENTKLNVLKENIKGSKLERLQLETERLQTGRVLVPNGEGWVVPFIDQILGFPALKHDEEVDCLTGAIRTGLGAGDENLMQYAR